MACSKGPVRDGVYMHGPPVEEDIFRMSACGCVDYRILLRQQIYLDLACVAESKRTCDPLSMLARTAWSMRPSGVCTNAMDVR